MGTTLIATALTTLAAVKTRLGLTVSTEDELLNQLINVVSDRIHQFCRRTFISSTYTSEAYDGDGGVCLFLNNYPVTAVSAVTEDDTALTENTDYTLHADQGILYREDGNWSAIEPFNIEVTYTAGYTFPSVALPTFSGSGLNDCTSGGTYTGAAAATFTLVIDHTGATDSLKWKKGSDAYTEDVLITGTAQTLSDGVTVTFGATTGHTAAATWSIAAQARTLPWDIEDAAIKQVCKAFNDAKHSTLGMTSRSMPDGSVSYVEHGEWLTEVRQVLERYMRHICV